MILSIFIFISKCSPINIWLLASSVDVTLIRSRSRAPSPHWLLPAWHRSSCLPPARPCPDTAWTWRWSPPWCRGCCCTCSTPSTQTSSRPPGWRRRTTAWGRRRRRRRRSWTARQVLWWRCPSWSEGLIDIDMKVRREEIKQVVIVVVIT